MNQTRPDTPYVLLSACVSHEHQREGQAGKGQGKGDCCLVQIIKVEMEI